MWIRHGNTFTNMDRVRNIRMTNDVKGKSVCRLYLAGNEGDGFILVRAGEYLDLLDEEGVFGNMAAHLKGGSE